MEPVKISMSFISDTAVIIIDAWVKEVVIPSCRWISKDSIQGLPFSSSWRIYCVAEIT